MSTSSAAVRQLSDGNSQGTMLGQSSTDKIGFYNVSSGAVTLQTLTTTAAVVATTASVSTSPFGFTTSTQANAIVTQLNATVADIGSIKALLKTYGFTA